MATTIVGTNDDLNDPIQWAVVELGGTVADIVDVTDADLATVAADDERYIVDVAELKLIDNILGNSMLVNYSVGPRSESLDQLRKALENKRDRLADQLEAAIGLGASSLTTGLIANDFAEHVETT